MGTHTARRVLVTGALGQIGSELTLGLKDRYGADNVIATDIQPDTKKKLSGDVPFALLDVLKIENVEAVVQKYKINTIYHLAALLSAVAERKPRDGWDINMNGLLTVLDAARANKCSLFFPSSIGAFGPSTPHDGTPQDTIQRPESMYGVTKVAGELLCDYYFKRFGVDTRGVRFPGIISNGTLPGGGTTDYAVEIFYSAIKDGKYTCFLKQGTSLDMMYMPDAIKAAIGVMEADPAMLKHRNSFNVTAMHFTPEMLAAEIRKHIKGFTMDYRVDPMRQRIADSWPNYMDDGAAREEWGWMPDFDLAAMTEDMIRVLGAKHERGLLS
jgi:nucleoside-diphosphate-sugar epimerase